MGILYIVRKFALNCHEFKVFFAAVMNILTLLIVIFTLQNFFNTFKYMLFFFSSPDPFTVQPASVPAAVSRSQQWFEATACSGTMHYEFSSLWPLAFVHTINSFLEAYQETHTLGASNTKNTF